MADRPPASYLDYRALFDADGAESIIGFADELRALFAPRRPSGPYREALHERLVAAARTRTLTARGRREVSKLLLSVALALAAIASIGGLLAYWMRARDVTEETSVAS